MISCNLHRNIGSEGRRAHTGRYSYAGFWKGCAYCGTMVILVAHMFPSLDSSRRPAWLPEDAMAAPPPWVSFVSPLVTYAFGDKRQKLAIALQEYAV